jgi:hypothetical protein
MSYKVNISIDDVSPHPRASINVLERCYELIEVFPDIKFSLFVPIAYWRTQKPITITKSPLILDQHPGFCEYIKHLPKENFEIGYHGYYHGIPGKNDNNEFLHMDYVQAKERIRAMYEVVERAGLKDTFKPMFRPPAWRMCPDAFDACRDMGIDLLAISDIDYALETYQGKDKEYENVTYSNVFPPFRELEMHEKTGIVYHACEWDRNYLSKEHTTSLIDFLKPLEDEIEFCFMDKF